MTAGLGGGSTVNKGGASAAGASGWGGRHRRELGVRQGSRVRRYRRDGDRDYGQLPDDARHVGLRSYARDDTLDVAFALVARLCEQVPAVGVRQVRREHPKGAQGNEARAQVVENHGPLLRGTRGLDSVVGRRLRQMQRLRAEHEE